MGTVAESILLHFEVKKIIHCGIKHAKQPFTEKGKAYITLHALISII